MIDNSEQNNKIFTSLPNGSVETFIKSSVTRSTNETIITFTKINNNDIITYQKSKKTITPSQITTLIAAALSLLVLFSVSKRLTEKTEKIAIQEAQTIENIIKASGSTTIPWEIYELYKDTEENTNNNSKTR